MLSWFSKTPFLGHLSRVTPSDPSDVWQKNVAIIELAWEKAVLNPKQNPAQLKRLSHHLLKQVEVMKQAHQFKTLPKHSFQLKILKLKALALDPDCSKKTIVQNLIQCAQELQCSSPTDVTSSMLESLLMYECVKLNRVLGPHDLEGDFQACLREFVQYNVQDSSQKVFLDKVAELQEKYRQIQPSLDTRHKPKESGRTHPFFSIHHVKLFSSSLKKMAISTTEFQFASCRDKGLDTGVGADIQGKTVVFIGMNQGVVGRLDKMIICSDMHISCPGLLFYNEKNRLGGYFHIGAFSKLGENSVAEDSIIRMLDFVKPTQVFYFNGGTSTFLSGAVGSDFLDREAQFQIFQQNACLSVVKKIRPKCRIKVSEKGKSCCGLTVNNNHHMVDVWTELAKKADLQFLNMTSHLDQVALAKQGRFFGDKNSAAIAGSMTC